MKAQVSVFIIIGLILLVVAGLMMYLVRINSNVDSEVERRYVITDGMEPLKLYVEECMEQVSQPAIIEIGKNGGTLKPQRFRWYLENKYNFLCQDEEGVCVHTPLFRQDIESELEEYILSNISKCIDLTVFKRQDFTIKTGDMHINVTIGREDLIIVLNYPINMQRGNFNSTVDRFTVNIREPLGLLYDKSIEIINSENSKGYYDIVDYMYSNGNDITIEKHRPYPDILYTLTNGDYLFRFALEGSRVPSTVRYGCCYNLYDKDCFKNVNPEICENKGGIFDMNFNCVCPESDDSNDLECGGRECRDCLKTLDYVTGDYSNEMRKHGESWCEYDSVAGLGYDYVGTRHYLHYCIDGQEYVEECRDFREELCTEKNMTLGSDVFNRGECRPNRWEECYKCDTPSCCLDRNYRDCDWKEWLNTESKCVPYVPPGFRFWEHEGSDICGAASETKECDGFSCPNIWVDDTALRCYAQGDCGNYRNVDDQMTYKGFFNSDFQDTVRDYVYLDDGLTKKGHDYSINLGGNRNQQTLVSTSFKGIENNFVQIVSAIVDYMDEMSSVSIADFLNPFDQPDIKVLDVALCGVWQAPSKGACETCNENRICTEYKCKSLGTDCEYRETLGVPECFAQHSDDDVGPTVKIESDYGTNETKLRVDRKTYDGYDIIQDIVPYEIFRMKVLTDEESICRIKYLPRLKYLQSPSFYFDDARFSTEHNISFRMPSRLRIPKRALDFLNISEADEILDKLETPRVLVDKYKTTYSRQIEIYDSITGGDLVNRIDPYIDMLAVFIDEMSDLVPFYKELFRILLENFQDGRYYLFVDCQDTAGNVNEKELFVTFRISNLADDVSPPKILGMTPENESRLNTDEVNMMMYVNEPADCRLDEHDLPYDEMKRQFSCSRQYTAKFSGSYPCTTTVNISTYYIRCMDKPPVEITGTLNLAWGAPDILGESPYLNVTGSTIKARLKTLGVDHKITVDDDVILQLYIDNPMNCTHDGIIFRKCVQSENIQLGQYMCEAEIGMSGNGSTRSVTLEMHQKDRDNLSGVNVSDMVSINVSVAEAHNIIYSNKTSMKLRLEFSGNYSCWQTDNYSVGSRPSCSGNLCFSNLINNRTYELNCSELATSEKPVEIKCRQPEIYDRNVNKKSNLYRLYRAEPLEITDSGPEGEIPTRRTVIFAETNHQSTCGYYRNFALGTVLMQKTSDTLHDAVYEGVDGTNVLYVVCNDEYGNEVTQKIEFFVG